MRTRIGRSLNTREKRALAAMAVAAALFLLLEFFVLPGMDSAEKLRAALPLREKTLRKYQQMVALAGGRETDWQSLQTRLAEAEKGLLDSRTPAVASAELQELVKQLMAQQGIEMRGANFLPARALKPAAAGYTAVPLSLGFECTLDQLASFLLAARSSSKVLALEQLTISTVLPRPDRPRKMVSVQIVIRGLMIVEPAAAPKS